MGGQAGGRLNARPPAAAPRGGHPHAAGLGGGAVHRRGQRPASPGGGGAGGCDGGGVDCACVQAAQGGARLNGEPAGIIFKV